ncbi:MAG: hypothetical protein RBR15_10405 [Sphaerochaeta sp.]|nr:hypothetical protein [Sphaerochaeta sp.]
MKKSRIVLVVLGILLLVAFVGCDSNKVATDGVQVSSYKKVTLSDLKPFEPMVTDNETIDAWPTDTLDWEEDLVSDGLSLMGATIDRIANNDFDSISPLSTRSIAAGLYLLIKDEGFRLDFEGTGEDAIDTYSEIEIQNMDFILNGKINSLSNLLSLMVFDPTMVNSAITADGRLQISGKIRAITNEDTISSEMKDEVSVVSMFIDLGISGSLPKPGDEGTPSGLLSGTIQFSIGSNVLHVYNTESSSYELKHSPVVLQLDIAPFKNVDLASVAQLVQDNGPKIKGAIEDEEPNQWAALKELMWPGVTGPVLTVTRTIGNFNATEARMTTTWTDEEALGLLFPDD